MFIHLYILLTGISTFMTSSEVTGASDNDRFTAKLGVLVKKYFTHGTFLVFWDGSFYVT